MLPQAFGPFSDNELIQKMQVIINQADLIFARDEISFDYLKALDKASTNIILRPDFTNLIKGKIPSDFNKTECEIAVIPPLSGG